MLRHRFVPEYIIRILVFWYSTQQLCVRWGHVVSETFTVMNGVRQGGILSPRLFNVYIDNLSINLRNTKIGCTVASTMINHLIYADDLLLLCPSAKGLQKLIKICSDFAIAYDIIFNADKTCCMVFQSLTFKLRKIPKLHLNDKMLKYVDSHKYLGVFLSNHCKDDDDIQRQTRNFYMQANILLRKFYHCSYDVKIMLFNSYCSSMYCASLWTKYRINSISKLRASYNNGFRRFFGYARDCSASNMLVSNNVNTFDSMWRKQIFNLHTRLEHCNNVLITRVLSSDIFYTSAILRHWRNMLYLL